LFKFEKLIWVFRQPDVVLHSGKALKTKVKTRNQLLQTKFRQSGIDRTNFNIFSNACIFWGCNGSRQDNNNSNVDTIKIISKINISSPPQPGKSDEREGLIFDSFQFDTILYNCFNLPFRDTNLINTGGQLAGGTTMGEIYCYDYAANKLDTLVNNVYIRLYAKLDNDDKLKLKLSQKNWRKFYYAEGEFLYSAFYTWTNKTKYGHGREHAITQAEWKYVVMRERLINLTKYDNEIWTNSSEIQ